MVMHHIERPQIVEAANVVCVRVGDEDKVDILDAVGQRLRAKIGPTIDEETASFVFDVGTRAHAFVSRIRGSANGTAAAKRGHAC
jgi:hypothetical protein